MKGYSWTIESDGRIEGRAKVASRSVHRAQKSATECGLSCAKWDGGCGLVKELCLKAIRMNSCGWHHWWDPGRASRSFPSYPPFTSSINWPESSSFRGYEDGYKVLVIQVWGSRVQIPSTYLPTSWAGILAYLQCQRLGGGDGTSWASWLAKLAKLVSSSSSFIDRHCLSQSSKEQ